RRRPVAPGGSSRSGARAGRRGGRAGCQRGGPWGRLLARVGRRGPEPRSACPAGGDRRRAASYDNPTQSRGRYLTIRLTGGRWPWVGLQRPLQGGGAGTPVVPPTRGVVRGRAAPAPVPLGRGGRGPPRIRPDRRDGRAGRSQQPAAGPDPPGGGQPERIRDQ